MSLFSIIIEVVGVGALSQIMVLGHEITIKKKKKKQHKSYPVAKILPFCLKGTSRG